MIIDLQICHGYSFILEFVIIGPTCHMNDHKLYNVDGDILSPQQDVSYWNAPNETIFRGMVGSVGFYSSYFQPKHWFTHLQ